MARSIRSCYGWCIIVLIVGISLEVFLYFQFGPLFPWPRPPLHLKAAPSAGQVSLAWSHLEENHSESTRWEYRCKKGRDEEYSSWMPVRENGLEREMTVTGLVNGIVHTFQVRRASEQDEDEWSNEVIIVPSQTERTLLEEIKRDTANVAANTTDILAEMKNRKKSQNIFCKDKKLLGTVRFSRDSSCVVAENISNGLFEKLEKLNKGSLVLVEGYASHDGDVLHNLKLSEERAVQVINYLRCKYCKAVSSIRFRPLAKGEAHPEAEPNRKNCCDRQVRLFSCGSALSSTSDAPAEEPDCTCEDAECKSDLDDDSPCAEVDSACAEYENLDCQRQNRI